jgi:hypothetical protein
MLAVGLSVRYGVRAGISSKDAVGRGRP